LNPNYTRSVTSVALNTDVEQPIQNPRHTPLELHLRNIHL